MANQNWPVARDLDSWMRQMEKRIMHNERRPTITAATDLLGPGFGPTSIQILDWNSAEALFSGFFWSDPGSLNTPDATKYWLGHTQSIDRSYGYQRVLERDGNREMIRRFTDLGTGATVMFTPWVPVARFFSELWSAVATIGSGLVDAVWSAVLLDSIVLDDDTLNMSSGAYPGGFPVDDTGVYVINGSVSITGTVGGTRRGSALFLNGSTTAIDGSQHLVATSDNGTSYPTGTVTIPLVSGDVVRLGGYQDSGGSVITLATAGARAAMFVRRIG